MHRALIALFTLAAAPTAAVAQVPALSLDPGQPSIPAWGKPKTPAQDRAERATAAAARITELEGLLARQTTIADNAGQELEKLRAEIALKDELLALGLERNAELFAAAKEIIDKVARPRGLDPFVQSSRVRMENLKQSYEDRLHAARIYPGTLPPSLQRRMDAELKSGAAEPAADPAVTPAPQN